MVDFHELSNVGFDSLESAATAWEQVALKLKSMDQDWDSTVIAKVNSACWSGPSADPARPGLQRTNEQLSAAATEANALASIFKDAAGEFQAVKAKLEKAVADARTDGRTVTGDGTVSWPPADNRCRAGSAREPSTTPGSPRRWDAPPGSSWRRDSTSRTGASSPA
ncbi:PPE domain-containing protein [Kitasatospora sp. NPDC004669]|uniref:PPE domain-containing protein n=1 Tax=Kitasatospora sp. NPDC004669 TaxID=3154555 RepID=UPI00339E3A71